jgi:predicted glutamine amidotransferase
MCRFTAYLGPPIIPADIVTRPSRSIITQSFAARERISENGYLNGDGFGLGWYPLTNCEQPDTSKTSSSSIEAPTARPQRSTPCVFVRFESNPSSSSLTTTTMSSFKLRFCSTAPAWNNENLSRLASSITSSLIFAHVRAVTAGTKVCECRSAFLCAFFFPFEVLSYCRFMSAWLILCSCHPFIFGRYMWMHNGGIGDFHKVCTALLPREFYNYCVESSHRPLGSCGDTFSECSATKRSLMPSRKVPVTRPCASRCFFPISRIHTRLFLQMCFTARYMLGPLVCVIFGCHAFGLPARCSG